MPPGHVKAKVGLSEMLMLLPTDRNYHTGTPIKYNLHLDIKSQIHEVELGPRQKVHTRYDFVVIYCKSFVLDER